MTDPATGPSPLHRLITATVGVAALAVPITGCAASLTPSPPRSGPAIPAINTAATMTTPPIPGISYAPSGAVYPAATCTAAGGETIENLDAIPVCAQIPYLGTDGQTYYAEVGFNPDGSLAGPADTEGVGATQAECTSGQYPELDGTGPG